MKNTSTTILFFGNERLATGVQTNTPILRSLIRAGYNIGAIISHNEPTMSRKPRPLEIAEVATHYNIPLLLPESLSDIHDTLKAYKATVGVLVAYGKLVPQDIIDIFPRGIINIHPSLLPLHRGSIPLESIILDGETSTGVSLMQLVKAMDAGPVYAQTTISVVPDITKQELADQLSSLGAGLLTKNLPTILDGSMAPTPQDETQATYDQRITKADAQLDWSKPALLLEREIRAYAGWPRSRAVIGNQGVTITTAHIVPGASIAVGDVTTDNATLVVQSGDQALCIDTLIPDGKKIMTGAAFISGYHRDLA
jgi:methionyl-tRNA formyltransferase